VAAAVSLIAETPEVAPVWLPMAQRRVRKWALRWYPFCLFYVVLDARLVILAVAHVRRRPGYWRSRLGT
jgi:toxin ParE1/3/4